MDIQDRKWDVMQKIMAVSKQSLLDKIDQLLEEEMIVGYTVGGDPLTKGEYNRRLEKAEDQIQKGQFMTQEDLERSSENW